MKENLAFAVRVAASLTLLTLCAVLMLALALVTLFQCRRCCSDWLLTPCGKLFLRLWGLRMAVYRLAPYPPGQTVFVMNHTSSIDMFAIVALGLPNTRFFLSGYLRKIVPLAVVGYLTGIFWTVDQQFGERRVRIFERACRILGRTGESVCLSPEGERITTGQIGPFNKGAFHLAAALRAPMQPVYIRIPKTVDPGKGWHARPGTIEVHIAAPIDTSAWRGEDAAAIKEEMRDYYRRWKEELGG
ncbi:MAG TPA: lysophospholipid acyltransferase family protein [Thiobacillaceae bacterium]|nr:lysophospholipid acyltransferase family protein [Thiobacillaceae bacterium]HNA80925.1 lysophospholipid acyltransferase family protein [Thiobacillaceae bacterium]HNF88202.1 lysophospholipid acyltransferase family protein [Thiobacillaceae bacterium]HNH88391.1 lysophospholipid acyltransferase family protein [Thiobacillaceae bacterium]HNI07447.1 lysophospholipid acyltransferase family protein [Thiobacillaceae bacterium]